MASVVLAEDNVDHQRIVAGVLHRLGHDVTVVDDGRAALAAVAEHRPDLIVADVDMPHLDGLQLCRRLRADPDLAGIPIMLLTAYLPPGDPYLAAAGATSVMTKPFKVQDLTAALRRHLTVQPAGAGPAPAAQGAAFVRALLDGVDAGVVACDATGRLTVLNPVLRDLGYFGDSAAAPREQWTQRARLRHHDGTPLPAADHPLLRALGGADVDRAHLLARDRDGQDHWVSINARPVRDPDGHIAGAVAAVHDVTDAYRARRFQDCTAEVLGVLSGSPDAAALGDEILHAVGSTLGWPYVRLWLVDEAADVLRPAAMFLAAGHEPLPLPAMMARGEGLAGLCWQRDDLLWVPDVAAPGSPLLPEVVAATTCRAAGAVPLHSGDRVTGVLTFFSDSPREPEPVLAVLLRGIAGTIGAYLERGRAEGLAARLAAATDEYLALVGHELRTPLTSISAYIELIADAPDATPVGELRALIEVVERNSSRLRALIDGLLEIAALESGHTPLAIGPVDLGEAVAAAVEAVAVPAGERRIAVEVHRPAGTVVSGDPDRLRQVVDHLLRNAVAFSPDGATVTVALAEVADAAVLTVADTGSGVADDEHTHVFRGLYRGRNAHHTGIPGAGLGLTLSRVVVERHHGTISLGRNPAGGTTVTVRLPRATG